MSLKPDQTQKAHQTLLGLPLFAGCSPADIQALVARLEFKLVGRGKVAMMDQEINRTLYVLHSGAVSVWKRVGGDKKQLAMLAAPNFFGERSMFEESPASALVKTESDCEVFMLDRTAFLEIAAQNPGMQEIIRQNMVKIRAERMGPETPKPEDLST